MEALRSFPAIGKDELIRYFTLTPADEATRPTLVRQRPMPPAPRRSPAMPAD
ncbi:hypothetical protein ACWEKM_26980 [Streptomyces sp. NPDC004752]